VRTGETAYPAKSDNRNLGVCLFKGNNSFSLSPRVLSEACQICDLHPERAVAYGQISLYLMIRIFLPNCTNDAMESSIVNALHLKTNPVAIIWSDTAPHDALQFRKGKWGCVMAMFAQTAAFGKTVAFDRETFGCLGGGVGLGFGSQYEHWRGGIDCFYGFLSNGNSDRDDAEEIADEIRQSGRKAAADRFLYGERIVKTPELARTFVNSLPIIDIPERYVLFKPLQIIDEKSETPKVIVFTANPDQLSALVSLANYSCGTLDRVVVRPGAGCQSIGILAYAEAGSISPRAVLGMTDIAARVYTAATLGHNVLTFAVPFRLFLELESNVQGSFLERETWRSLTEAVR
jgi:uncharacterized protein (DUF169 family)